MMKPVLALLGMCVLASCGADGAPIRPTLSNTISVGSGGVQTSTNVGVQSGNVSVNVGL